MVMRTTKNALLSSIPLMGGWSTSLEKMPMFTRAEMNEHIARSGNSKSFCANVFEKSQDVPRR